jgi:S1-C subfamily serine protease
MVLDVQINPGNSGGPLCDRSGRVVGVVAAKTFTERFVQGYGLAIPMSDAVKFVKANVSQFVDSAPAANTKEWTEVDAGISKSTVLILIKKKKR